MPTWMNGPDTSTAAHYIIIYKRAMCTALQRARHRPRWVQIFFFVVTNNIVYTDKTFQLFFVRFNIMRNSETLSRPYYNKCFIYENCNKKKNRSNVGIRVINKKYKNVLRYTYLQGDSPHACSPRYFLQYCSCSYSKSYDFLIFEYILKDRVF